MPHFKDFQTISTKTFEFRQLCAFANFGLQTWGMVWRTLGALSARSRTRFGVATQLFVIGLISAVRPMLSNCASWQNAVKCFSRVS